MRPILIFPVFLGASLLLVSAAAAQMNNLPVVPDMRDKQAAALNERYIPGDYDQGVDALTAGRFRDAERYLARAVKAKPQDPTLLTVYGQALEGMKDWRGAESAFARALSLNNDQLLARREHGVVLARLGQIASATAELNALKARADACDGDCVGAADLNHAVDVVRAALADASSSSRPGGTAEARPQGPVGG